MNQSLAELQKNFANALHYQATGDACDICSDTFSADERMQIYRNNFIISLSEVLQATYPMVLALVGEECFEQMARSHVLNHPLHTGDVTDYGEHFATTIEAFPAVVEAAPYAADVARFEWQIDVSQQRQGSVKTPEDIWPIARLAEVAEQQQPNIHFHLSPGTLPFHSPYAVYALRLAIENNDFEQLTLHQAEYGVIISQPDGQCWTMALDQLPFELLQYPSSGCTLGEIPEPQLPYLGVLLENQLISGFSLAQ